MSEKKVNPDDVALACKEASKAIKEKQSGIFRTTWADIQRAKRFPIPTVKDIIHGSIKSINPMLK